jgi:hypothetical protein
VANVIAAVDDDINDMIDAERPEPDDDDEDDIDLQQDDGAGLDQNDEPDDQDGMEPGLEQNDDPDDQDGDGQGARRVLAQHTKIFTNGHVRQVSMTLIISVLSL